jgi:hypothetical protein
MMRISSLHKSRKLTISNSVQNVTLDDIHGEEGCICIADIESGVDAGGTLTLSRPVAATISINPNAAALVAVHEPSSSPIPPLPETYVPNLCAICLDSYQPGEIVAWSSGCTHAFHQDCICHYLAKKMIGGETPCPSCRQRFCDLLPEEPLPPSSPSAANDANTTSESREARQPSV